jgi:hypothetical protein
VNQTAIDTLERRLKVTRAAMEGELERARNAATQAANARDRAAEHGHTITDLETALAELRGWTAAPPANPLDAPCPSCGAGIGDPCRAPNGDPVEPHTTRGATT